MSGITQTEIADQLGISRSTVAKALHPRLQTQLSVQRRQSILQTAERLGYRPHRQAQLMRGVKSHVIGIIKTTGMVQTGVERSFYASQAIQVAGYGLLVNELHWDQTGERRAVDAMLDAHVEGVLLAGLANMDDAVMAELQRLRDAKIPVVAVGGVRLPAIPVVTTDYRQGMAELTKHVLSLGYRNLALVSMIRPDDANLSWQWGFAERLAGFGEATAAAGLNAAQARVLHQPLTTGWTDSYAPGQAAIQQLVASGDRPAVLLCSNDDMAIGAIAACVEAGWRVPADIAITGFDNSTVGRYVVPPLTTMAQPTEAVAKQAVELLLKQMRGETISASTALVKLPCQLVVRQSCGAKQKERTQP